MRAALVPVLLGGLAGFAIGSVLGPEVLPSGSKEASAPGAARPGGGAPPEADAARLRAELSAARKERDAARARAERAEEQVQALTKLSLQLDAGSAEGAAAARLSPEEARARAAELKEAFEAAFARGDGKGVLEAFASLNTLGEGAFGTIAELHAKLDEAALQRLGISHMAFWRSFGTPYLAWAATSSDLKGEQRAGAIYGLAYREPERIIERFGALIGGEKDPEVARAMLWALGSSRDERAVSAIAAAARDGADPRVRARAYEQLGDYDTPESVATVRAALEGLSDPEVGQAALLSWRKLRPPESGILVEWARTGAAKAGLQRGDLVTAVNGVAVSTTKEMQERLAAGGTVTVLRLDGSTETLKVDGKIDGINSRDVVRRD